MKRLTPLWLVLLSACVAGSGPLRHQALPGDARLLRETRAEPVPIVAPDEATVRRAHALIAEGRELYGKGRYDEAEDLLKQAISLYPFVAEANLLQGKIFLIRGAARRDMALIDSARLMFEMAAALDPKASETQLLLELLKGTDP